MPAPDGRAGQRHPSHRSAARARRAPAAAALLTLLLAVASASCSRADTTATQGTTTPPATSSTQGAAGASTSSTAPPATGPLVGPTAPTTTEHIRTGGPASTVVAQEDLLLNAVTGTWKGDAGTLTFAGDGTATLELKDCPLQPAAPQFGFTTGCAPRTYHGTVSVGSLQLLVSDDTGIVGDFGVYVDADGHLHLGSGGAFVATPTLQTEIRLGHDRSDGVITVDGDHCERSQGNDPPAVVPCQWTTREGFQVLVVEDRVYVYEKDLGLVASPQARFSVFTR